jgi:hypothetical protein
MLFDELKDVMCDDGDIDDSIHQKIESIIGGLTSTMHPLEIEGGLSSTSDEDPSLSLDAFAPEQAVITTEIMSAVQQNTKK